MSRPRITITDEMLVQIEKASRHGCNKKQIADLLGFSYKTFERNQRRNKKIDEAFRRGKAKGANEIGATLYELALQGSITACIEYLRIHAGWRETEPETSSVDTRAPLIIQLTEKDNGGTSRIETRLKGLDRTLPEARRDANGANEA